MKDIIKYAVATPAAVVITGAIGWAINYGSIAAVFLLIGN